jgi:hypothetical protein
MMQPSLRAEGETPMTRQALIYGVILSWVPSIVLLAWLLWLNASTSMRAAKIGNRF